MPAPLILIVDDEYFLADAIADRLHSLEYKTAICDDGAQALEWLSKNKCQAILMDIMMPIMDGLTATRRLKGDDSLKEIPIIMLTARALDCDRKEALECGAEDYVAKPFEWADLVAKIKKWTQN